MKILAGWKLKIRKPRQAPASAAERITTFSSLPLLIAAAARIPATMATTPAASPSTPSRRLIVFCIPSSQNSVSG